MTKWSEVKANLKSLSDEEIAEIEELSRLQTYIMNQENINESFKQILIQLVRKEVEVIKNV